MNHTLGRDKDLGHYETMARQAVRGPGTPIMANEASERRASGVLYRAELLFGSIKGLSEAIEILRSRLEPILATGGPVPADTSKTLTGSTEDSLLAVNIEAATRQVDHLWAEVRELTDRVRL